MLKEIIQEDFYVVSESIPLGWAGRPEDIAVAVCFLASNRADFITGEIMDVDGGLMMD